MHESIVFCSACTMSSQRKFTFAISSSDEFLVVTYLLLLPLPLPIQPLVRISANYPRSPEVRPHSLLVGLFHDLFYQQLLS